MTKAGDEREPEETAGSTEEATDTASTQDEGSADAPEAAADAAAEEVDAASSTDEHEDNGSDAPHAVEDEVPPLSATELALAATRMELDSVRGELQAMTARLRTVSRAFQDQREEMAAFRTRTEERQKVEASHRAVEVVRTFFDPVMNLKRSLDAEGDLDSLREGVQMVHRQFMDALERLGLERAPAEGARFDPAIHEAIGVVPVDDPSLDGVVIAAHTEGWVVQHRAVEAAKVTVGKHIPVEPTPEA